MDAVAFGSPLLGVESEGSIGWWMGMIMTLGYMACVSLRFSVCRLFWNWREDSQYCSVQERRMYILFSGGDVLLRPLV